MNNIESEQKIARKKYSPQFKDLALERVEKEGVSQVAKDLGLGESLLYSWKAHKNKVDGSQSVIVEHISEARLSASFAKLSP